MFLVWTDSETHLHKLREQLTKIGNNAKTPDLITEEYQTKLA